MFINNFNKYNDNIIFIKMEDIENCNKLCLNKFPYMTEDNICNAIIKIIIKNNWSSDSNKILFGISSSLLLDFLHNNDNTSMMNKKNIFNRNFEMRVRNIEICALIQIIKDIKYLSIYSYKLPGKNKMQYLITGNNDFIKDRYKKSSHELYLSDFDLYDKCSIANNSDCKEKYDINMIELSGKINIVNFLLKNNVTFKTHSIIGITIYNEISSDYVKGLIVIDNNILCNNGIVDRFIKHMNNSGASNIVKVKLDTFYKILDFIGSEKDPIQILYSMNLVDSSVPDKSSISQNSEKLSNDERAIEEIKSITKKYFNSDLITIVIDNKNKEPNVHIFH